MIDSLALMCSGQLCVRTGAASWCPSASCCWVQRVLGTFLTGHDPGAYGNKGLPRRLVGRQGASRTQTLMIQTMTAARNVSNPYFADKLGRVRRTSGGAGVCDLRADCVRLCATCVRSCVTVCDCVLHKGVVKHGKSFV